MTAWGVAQIDKVLDKAETEGPQLVKRGNAEFLVTRRQQSATQNEHTQPDPSSEMSGKELWDFLRPPPESRFEEDLPRPGDDLRRMQTASNAVHAAEYALRNMSGEEFWEALRCPPTEGPDTDFPRLQGALRRVDL